MQIKQKEKEEGEPHWGGGVTGVDVGGGHERRRPSGGVGSGEEWLRRWRRGEEAAERRRRWEEAMAAAGKGGDGGGGDMRRLRRWRQGEEAPVVEGRGGGVDRGGRGGEWTVSMEWFDLSRSRSGPM